MDYETKLIVFSAVLLLAGGALVFQERAVETSTTEFRTNASMIAPGDKNVSLGVQPSSALDFGTYEAGTVDGINKTLRLRSPEKSLAVISSTGNISRHLRYTKSLIFKGEERVEIRFEPDGIGYYEGNLTVKIQKPQNEVALEWLKLKSRLLY